MEREGFIKGKSVVRAGFAKTDIFAYQFSIQRSGERDEAGVAGADLSFACDQQGLPEVHRMSRLPPVLPSTPARFTSTTSL